MVGGSKITKATLDRWTVIEAAVVYSPNPTQPVPKGAIPDPPTYANCIAYLHDKLSEIHAASVPTSTQLKAQCKEEHTVLQHQILEILITSKWLTAEAAKRGIGVSEADAKRVLHEKFGTSSALHRFLALTGEKEADELFLLKRTMLANRVRRAFERSAGTRAAGAKQEVRFFSGIAKKWTGRTSCLAGYVVPQCRQYHAR